MYFFLKKNIYILGKWISSIYLSKKEVFIYTEKQFIYQISRYYKKHTNTRYEVCSDITAMDNVSINPRYALFYIYMSLKYNNRLSVCVNVSDLDYIPSIVQLHPSANWLEREVWDMFGLFFVNHPDLRRILTDYGFRGHPLRKDYPLSGYQEVRYDDTLKRVVSEAVELTQDFRVFEFNSPWEGNTSN